MRIFLKNITVCILALIMAATLALPVSGAATPSDTGEKPAAKAVNPKADILNSATEALSPSDPKSAELSAYLDELLAEILNDEMDTYEKVKACYDYVMATTKYGSNMANLGAKIGTESAGMTTCREIMRKYGAVEGFGAVALSARVGMCNAYASAFILMARKIGLDAYLVKGYTKSAGGGYAYHEWCEIKIGEDVYAFDPQLDQSLARSGLKKYMVFCAEYSKIPGRYSK